MTTSLNKVSTFIEAQLPAFIVDDYPVFVEFLKKYYEFLEQPGNPIYELKKFDDNYDIDLTRESLLRYFKNKILPSFPEETELSTERIIKASRDFYAKKGTPESFKFLFRVLYNTDIEVFFPKLQILKASDGKWVQPQAFRLTLSPQNEGFDVNILEKRKAYGSISRASCIIEQAYTTIDKGTGREIVEIYISSLNRFFQNGEYLEVEYIDENEQKQVFSEKIIGSLSNIKINPKKRGLKYRTGDPVVINGGLDVTSPTRLKAAAVVGNVTSGSIETASVLVDGNGTLRGGYGFSLYPNTVIDVISTSGIGAGVEVIGLSNPAFQAYIGVPDPSPLTGTPSTTMTVQVTPTFPLQIGMLVTGEDVLENTYITDFDSTSGSYGGTGRYTVSQSQYVSPTDTMKASFTTSYSTDSILYMYDHTINNQNYNFDNAAFTYANLTIGAGNSTTTVNLNTDNFVASTVDDYYTSLLLTVRGGTGRTATPNSATIIDYNGTTKIATLSTALGTAPDGTSNISLSANASTTLGKCFSWELQSLGSIRYVSVENGGSFFEDEPALDAVSLYNTDFSTDVAFESTGIFPFQKFEKSDAGNIPTFTYYPNTLTIEANPLNDYFSTLSSHEDYYLGWRIFFKSNDTADQFRTITKYEVDLTSPNPLYHIKRFTINRKFENNINQINFSNKDIYLDSRAQIRYIGRIAAIEVLNGGKNYSSSDTVNIVGSGYNAQASLIVNNSGVITGVKFPSFAARGEGYPVAPTVTVTSSTGTGASLKAYLFGDGEEFDITTDYIGQIKDIILLSRGSDYIATPNVSLKIYDLYVDALDPAKPIYENDLVYQKNVNGDYIFKATVESTYSGSIADPTSNIPDTTHNVIRVFDYSGVPVVDRDLVIVRNGYPEDTTSQEIQTTIVRSKEVDILDPNDASVVLYKKIYPWHYGNGTAKATAYFLNGLIKYNGFYLNTDGHISSDKRLQDSNRYHNYSYSILASIPFPTYYKTIADIVHPAGTKFIPIYTHECSDRVAENITANVNTQVLATSSLIGNCTVERLSTTVTGSGSESFDAFANVGDLIVINTGGYPQFTKIITDIVTENNLTIESPCVYMGEGRIATTSGSADIVVSGNTNPLNYFIQNIGVDGDLIVMNVSGDIYKTVVSITGDTITLNSSVGITATESNLLYGVAPKLSGVEYKIINSVNDIIDCDEDLAAAPSPPAIASGLSPVVSGNTTVGSVLTATNGSWTGNPDSFTYSYQWMRDGEAYIGTNNNIYTTICDDVGSSITCIVTAMNGVSPNGTATSNSFGTIVDIVPECTAAPSISLSQESCVTYYATGTGTTSFYWQDFYATRHVHEPNQIGSVFLEFAQTYHPYGAGCSSPGSSCTYTLLNETPTSFDINLISPGTTPPGGSISSYTVGTLSDTCNVLTASTGTWTGNPTLFEYQWYRGSTPISGATSSSHITTSLDIGSYIRCEVTATGGNCGSQQGTTSLPYGPINA